MLERREDTWERVRCCFPFLSGYLERRLLCGTKEFDGAESGAWLAAKKWEREKEREATSEWVLEELPKAFHALPADYVARPPARQCDKVLFFTKPPSVAQARPIRRQWLVNSCQSGGKPRRDRDHGAILLMNYLNGRNNNVLAARASVLILRQNISRDDKNFVRRARRDFPKDNWDHAQLA